MILILIQFPEGFLGTGHFAAGRFFRAEESIIVGVFEADAPWLASGKRLRHLPTNADANGWIATDTIIIEVTPQPACGFSFVSARCSLPDFGGTKMRAVRIWIADALN